MTARGRFITLEGGEGVGKSTQARALIEHLRARGLAVVGTREPGGSPQAEEIRKVLLSGAAATLGAAGETLLLAAARIDHVDTLIRPALTAGRWVVCDRFLDSTRAYQGALGNLDATVLRAFEDVAVQEIRPDLTLVFDMPAEIGIGRAAARRQPDVPADRFECQPPAFHEALREAFLAIAAAEPLRCAVIDARGEPDEVARVVWRIVAERLALEPAASGRSTGSTSNSATSASTTHAARASSADLGRDG